MMQHDLILDDNELESLFDAARDDVMVASEALMDRIDADADLAAGAYMPNLVYRPDKLTLIDRFLLGIGGWRGATGLATAAVVGGIVGFGAPGTVYSFSPSQWTSNETSDTEEIVSYVVEDLVPSFYDLAVEG